MGKGSLVQLRNGLIGIVSDIDKHWIKLEEEGNRKYAKSEVCKVLKTELKEGERVRTTTGIAGTIVAADDRDVVTILSGTFMTFDIDRKTICEVLPATDESKKAAWIAKETAQDVREALANLAGGK